MKRLVRGILLVGLVMVGVSSCKPLKEYEKIYINDPDMQLGNSAPLQFKSYVHSIREGSIEAISKKGSGGCGCN
ncbi:MAG: DUF4266 domain-containing protein [Flavobacteriaceae bacterium]|nr:DUF4266 domain-containing protein [Flavobacteriaceae bacterium]